MPSAEQISSVSRNRPWTIRTIIAGIDRPSRPAPIPEESAANDAAPSANSGPR